MRSICPCCHMYSDAETLKYGCPVETADRKFNVDILSKNAILARGLLIRDGYTEVSEDWRLNLKCQRGEKLLSHRCWMRSNVLRMITEYDFGLPKSFSDEVSREDYIASIISGLNICEAE